MKSPDPADRAKAGHPPDAEADFANGTPVPHPGLATAPGERGSVDVWGRTVPVPKQPEPLPWVSPPAEWLTDEPPRRAYLLHDRDPNALGERGAGMLPRGKVGILAAAGGVGKTYALCGLALAVVTRRHWLDHFPVSDSLQRRAVLVLGEEDPGELQRRLHVQARAMRLTADECAAVTGILALPGAGLSLALTQPEEYGTGAATSFATELFEVLKSKAEEAGAGWDVVILDPLSRFAGPDVETDNAAATRLIQVLERFTKLPGEPAVIVAHHTSKSDRTHDTGTAGVRGSSAITDGARWVAKLEDVPVPVLAEGSARLPGHARFRVTKSNYGRFPPGSLTLTREEGGGGLRASTRPELDALKRAEDDAKREEGRKDAEGKAAKKEGAKAVTGGANKQTDKPKGDRLG